MEPTQRWFELRGEQTQPGVNSRREVQRLIRTRGGIDPLVSLSRFTMWTIDESNSAIPKYEHDFSKVHILCKLINRQPNLKQGETAGDQDLRMSSIICLPIRYTYRLFDLLRGWDRKIQQHLRFD